MCIRFGTQLRAARHTSASSVERGVCPPGQTWERERGRENRRPPPRVCAMPQPMGSRGTRCAADGVATAPARASPQCDLRALPRRRASCAVAAMTFLGPAGAWTEDERQRYLIWMLQLAQERLERDKQAAGEEATGAVARQLLADVEALRCPEVGLGVGRWARMIEHHHYERHRMWAENLGFCDQNGLWTEGCGVMCPLRAAAVGLSTGLGFGKRVLDIGSACGHFARWYHTWFGAATLGVDFVERAVNFSEAQRPRGSPMKFCWADVATGGLAWLPERFFDLATAVSVLHYMRTDVNLFELKLLRNGSRQQRWNVTRTPCSGLAATEGTQCRAAREMFRSVRAGGRIWVSHNGCYNGKWDPKRVWGPEYWRCCFRPELRAKEAELMELPEADLFLHDGDFDPTYSLVVLRLPSAESPVLPQVAVLA